MSEARLGNKQEQVPEPQPASPRLDCQGNLMLWQQGPFSMASGHWRATWEDGQVGDTEGDTRGTQTHRGRQCSLLLVRSIRLLKSFSLGVLDTPENKKNCVCVCERMCMHIVYTCTQFSREKVFQQIPKSPTASLEKPHSGETHTRTFQKRTPSSPLYFWSNWAQAISPLSSYKTLRHLRKTTEGKITQPLFWSKPNPP